MQNHTALHVGNTLVRSATIVLFVVKNFYGIRGEMQMEIKLNDVYSFSYNDAWCKKIFDPNWCFDGQLIVTRGFAGNLYLKDTYWGSSGDNKCFTLEEALERGELKFICNLDDVEQINAYALDYYDDEDLFDLSRQHGCYKLYYKRKGSKRSANKMERVLKDKICNMEGEIKARQSDLKWYKEKLNELKNGNIDIRI
jgi:hypothetical protein